MKKCQRTLFLIVSVVIAGAFAWWAIAGEAPAAARPGFVCPIHGEHWDFIQVNAPLSKYCGAYCLPCLIDKTGLEPMRPIKVKSVPSAMKKAMKKK